MAVTGWGPRESPHRALHYGLELMEVVHRLGTSARNASSQLEHERARRAGTKASAPPAELGRDPAAVGLVANNDHPRRPCLPPQLAESPSLRRALAARRAPSRSRARRPVPRPSAWRAAADLSAPQSGPALSGPRRRSPVRGPRPGRPTSESRRSSGSPGRVGVANKVEAHTARIRSVRPSLRVGRAPTTPASRQDVPERPGDDDDRHGDSGRRRRWEAATSTPG